MATYTLDATVSEQNDIRLQGVSLGRYNGDYKEADIQTQYVSGDYRERQYTAQDTPQDATGRRWRWTATDIYGNTGSTTVPRDRIQLSADIVTCEDARIVWGIEGNTVSNATVTISQNGTTVTTFSVTDVEGNHIVGGGLEPETTYNVILDATVDGDNLSGSCTFTTEAFVPNYLSLTNIRPSGTWPGRIAINRTGNVPSSGVQYTKDPEDGWYTWNFNTIYMDPGDTIYFRGTTGSFSLSDNDYYTISALGEYDYTEGIMFEVNGDANFLLSRKGGLIATPDHAFYNLFYGQTHIRVGNLKFGGKVTTGSKAFAGAFRETSITTCPTFDLLECGVYSDSFLCTFQSSQITSFNPFPNYVKNLYLDYTCSYTPVTTAVIKASATFNQSYLRTFRDCGSLASVTLKIQSVNGCPFDGTFYGCTALTSITLDSDCGDFPNGFTLENNWLLNASTTGILHKPSALQFPANSLPYGWTISNDVTV